jgi:hypothetical protein
LGWRNSALSIDAELAVERHQAPAGDDQRVELDQAHVALDVQLVQRLQDLREFADLGAARPRPKASSRHW